MMCEVAVNQDLDDLEKIKLKFLRKVLKHKPIFILKRSEIKWTILNDNKQDIRSQQELEDESKPRTCLKYDRNDALMDLGHSVNVSKR
ncbi:16620_t:CDS:2, partial [Rhizophagus irregularis]